MSPPFSAGAAIKADGDVVVKVVALAAEAEDDLAVLADVTVKEAEVEAVDVETVTLETSSSMALMSPIPFAPSPMRNGTY